MKKLTIYIGLWAISFSLAWLLQINPEKEYGWFMGLIHGGLLIPNWVISWFKSDWLIVAPHHTIPYMVFLWIVIFWSVLGWFAQIISNFRK